MTSAASQPAATPLDSKWVRGRFTCLDTGYVFMENAGGSVPLASAVNRISDYLTRCAVQVGASYGPSAEATRRLDQARTELASLFATGGGAAPEDARVAIGASTTSLFSRLARALAPSLSAGDEVLVTDADHEANIGPWLRLEARGVRVRTWRINRDTLRLEPEDLSAALSDRTRLVCFTHASNVLGTVTDAAAICRRAREAGAMTCVDGVAFAPHRAVSVDALGADWYGFSLYKVFGPHCAVLAGAADATQQLASLNHAWMKNPSPATRLEPGAFPYELAWGAGAVPGYLADLARHHQGDDAFAVISAHESALVARLLEGLGASPRVRIVGDRSAGAGRLPTVSFLVDGRTPAEIVSVTDAARIGIRAGHFYAPRLLEALGIAPDPGVIRVSLAHYNTLEEVDRLLSVLEPLL
ncbi:MAG: aminotransferase class V-fold PLP-dependent enzyme [Gammaproteobacteria bacterium]